MIRFHNSKLKTKKFDDVHIIVYNKIRDEREIKTKNILCIMVPHIYGTKDHRSIPIFEFVNEKTSSIFRLRSNAVLLDDHLLLTLSRNRNH